MLTQVIMSMALSLPSAAAFSSDLGSFLSERRVPYMSCDVNNRPKTCTAIYDPVCAVSLDSTEVKKYTLENFGSGCSACGVKSVSGYYIENCDKIENKD
jgi:hypothetical protein